jgi:hypothetical protein
MLTVLNTTTDRLIANVSVGAYPSGLDISQNDQELYVGLDETNSLAVVNLDTLTLNRTIPLSISPADVAAGRQGRVYVTAFSTDLVYPAIANTASNQQIGNITSGGPIGGNALAMTSRDRGTLYVADRTSGLPSTIYKFSVGGDNVTLVSESSPVNNPIYVNDLAFSPDGSRVYIAATYPYYVDIRNSTDWNSLGELPTGSYPSSVSLAANGSLAFAALGGSGRVMMFNTTTSGDIRNFATYERNGGPFLVRANADGSKIYVLDSPESDSASGILEVIDTRTGSLHIFGASAPYWPVGSLLKATDVGPTSLTLKWSSAADSFGVVQYRINATVMTDVPNSLSSFIVGGTPGSIFSLNVTGLVPGYGYLFKVDAENALGNWSTIGPTVEVFTTLAATTTPGISSNTRSGTTEVNTTQTGPVGQTFDLSSQIGGISIGIGIAIAGIAIAWALNKRWSRIDSAVPKAAEGEATGAKPVQVTKLKCPNCGGEVFANEVFCYNCGQRLPSGPQSQMATEGSPSTAVSVISERRPTGLTIISILWLIVGIYNILNSANRFNSDIGAYPLLSTPTSNLNSTQIATLNWLQAGLPIDTALAALGFGLALGQIFVVYGLWTGKWWSYKGALAFVTLLTLDNVSTAALYYSAPALLGLTDPTYAAQAAGSIIFLFVYWGYLTRSHVKRYLHVQ